MFEAHYREIRIEVTLAAYREMEKYPLELSDVVECLEAGFDCQPSRRKAGIMERCIGVHGKLLRVVVALAFNYTYNEEVWKLVHVSIGNWPKGLKRNEDEDRN